MGAMASETGYERAGGAGAEASPGAGAGAGAAPGNNPRKNPRKRPGKFVRVVSWLALPVPWVYAVVVAMPSRPYLLDVVCHFGPQVGAALLAIAALFAVARCRRFALSAALAGVVTIGLAAREWTTPGGAARAGERVLRVAHYNSKGDESGAFVAWLREQDADLVCLVESSPSLLAANPWIEQRYPFRVEPQPGLMWQMLLLSKEPFEAARLVQGEAERVNWQSFLARRSVVVRPEGRAPFLFGGTHPASPRTKETWRSSVRQCEGDGEIVREWLVKRPMPAIISGDFNSSPCGAAHRAFRASSGLTGWAPLFGGGTWHSKAGRWLAIPIDTVFTGGGARVISARVGPRFASDHRPVVWDVAVREGAPGQTPGQAPGQPPGHPSGQTPGTTPGTAPGTTPGR